MKKTHLLSVLALGISAACHAETYPAPVGPSQSDFGGVGLLQTPTARMAREGEMSLNYRDNDQYRYYSASVQLFPWLETTLRYTDVRTKKYSSVESFSGDQTYKDKAFDVKLRLWEESYWMPQVAVGARDIGGTGLFDAEYIVASKAWGPFDFSLGLGWGYLGTSGNVSNPFCSYSDKFCLRDNSYKEAGSVDGSDMFHGPASLFGGVEYQTPWQPLRLKLEYEGNNYQQDFAGKLEQKSKFNVGAIYRVTDWADVNLSYERGNTFMFGVTLRTNFNDLRPAYHDNSRPQYRPQPQDAILQHSVVANQLTLLKYNAGLADPKIQVKGDTLYVTGEQVKYRDSREGIVRANRIVMNDLPRVRTHVREYVQNDVYVNNLQANYFQYFGNGFYGQVYGGYLETMFGGAGAEVLYRPLDSNWAFGLDANYVKQRDWRSAQDMMKFTDYSVKTGHLTAYWTPSFAQDVLVKASVGQYLAGDKGGTLEIAKRFDSGVVVGGYATITDASPDEYGEGDFTKGVYVSVPLDLFSSGPTRSRAAIGWTPLTRDGGQQLGRKFGLYDMTSDRSVNFR